MKKKSKVSKTNVRKQSPSFGGVGEAVILFLFAFLLYANTLHHEYAFDDSVSITENSFTQKGIQGIPDLLTKDFFEGIYGHALEIGGGRWRPLSLVTFALEHQFFGNNPFISHLVNVLLYALTSIVLFRVLQKLFPGKILLSFIATLLFIAHPTHTEVVANIKSRDEILSFLGLCLTIYWLFLYLESNKVKYSVFSCIAYFLALTSKENGITFIAVLPLTLFCFAGKTWKESFTKALPLFVIAVLFVLLRWKLVGIVGDKESNDIMENPFVGTAMMQKYATITKILGKYLLLLFFPITLSSDYSFNEIPIVGWMDMGVIVSLLAYAALIVYAIRNLRNKSTMGNWQMTTFSFSILFYILTLSLASNIVFNIGAPMADRFLYLPSLGFCLAVAVLLVKLFKVDDLNTLTFNSRIFIPAAILVVFYSYRTIARNPDWKNNKTLFTADALNVPGSAKVHHYCANSYLTPVVGKPDSPEKTAALNIALREESMAVQINPKFHHAWYNLGLIYQEFQKGDSALLCLNKVLEIQPMHVLSQGVLGSVYGKLKGNYDSAIVHLNIAVKYNPKDGGSWENLGIAQAMKGNFAESANAFSEAVKYKSDDARLYLNAALTYQNLKDTLNAKKYFDKAFELDPGLKANPSK